MRVMRKHTQCSCLASVSTLGDVCEMGDCAQGSSCSCFNSRHRIYGCRALLDESSEECEMHECPRPAGHDAIRNTGDLVEHVSADPGPETSFDDVTWDMASAIRTDSGEPHSSSHASVSTPLVRACDTATSSSTLSDPPTDTASIDFADISIDSASKQKFQTDDAETDASAICNETLSTRTLFTSLTERAQARKEKRLARQAQRAADPTSVIRLSTLQPLTRPAMSIASLRRLRQLLRTAERRLSVGEEFGSAPFNMSLTAVSCTMKTRLKSSHVDEDTRPLPSPTFHRSLSDPRCCSGLKVSTGRYCTAQNSSKTRRRSSMPTLPVVTGLEVKLQSPAPQPSTNGAFCEILIDSRCCKKVSQTDRRKMQDTIPTFHERSINELEPNTVHGIIRECHEPPTSFDEYARKQVSREASLSICMNEEILERSLIRNPAIQGAADRDSRTVDDVKRANRHAKIYFRG